MKKLLIIVPTKNRDAMVKEVLEYELPYYSQKAINLCYFDSSDDTETEKVIFEESRKFNFDIIYRKSPVDLCIDYKLVEILKEIKTWDYDYFWLINDSVSILEEMLDYVLSKLDEGFDIIRLPLSGEGDTDDFVTDDVNRWFYCCSQGMAHMASTIISKSLINIVDDYDDLREKYVYNNELDDKHGYFFTVGYYLEAICRLPVFCGLFIGNKMKWRRDSSLKGTQIYWKKYVFETWAKSYPETILKLPDIYDRKTEVIRKSDNIGPGRFSRESLIHYRLQGLYSWKTFWKYKKFLKYVTDEKMCDCMRIAITPIAILSKKYSYLISGEEAWESRLEEIEKEIGKQSIVVYGAGLYGCKVLDKLVKDGFTNQIHGVAVSNIQNNVDVLNGFSVKQIDDYLLENDNFVIVCALPATSRKMKEELVRRNFKNYRTLFGV